MTFLALACATVIAAAVSYESRRAGVRFVCIAFAAFQPLFVWERLAADDPFWALELALFLPSTLGALVLAFGLARLLRSGSPMT